METTTLPQTYITIFLIQWCSLPSLWLSDQVSGSHGESHLFLSWLRMLKCQRRTSLKESFHAGLRTVMLFWFPKKKNQLKIVPSFRTNTMCLCFLRCHLEIGCSNMSFFFALSQGYSYEYKMSGICQITTTKYPWLVFHFLMSPRGQRQQKHLHSLSRFLSVNENAEYQYSSRGSWRKSWWR